MKQVLCVIDFSESAGRVLEVAARIANACGAHLLVLFPYRLIRNGFRGDIPALKIQLEAEAKANFEKLRGNLPGFKGFSYEFLPEIGFLSDRISAHTRKNNIDLIVIGQQAGDPSGDFKDRDIQKLIGRSRMPFVIVPVPIPAETGIPGANMQVRE